MSCLSSERTPEKSSNQSNIGGEVKKKKESKQGSESGRVCTSISRSLVNARGIAMLDPNYSRARNIMKLKIMVTHIMIVQ